MIDESPKIAISYNDDACEGEAHRLALELGLPFGHNAQASNEYKYYIVVTTSKLELHQVNGLNSKPVSVDFFSNSLKQRSARLRGEELLAKAVGIKRFGKGISVLDATAGFGKDAYILASLGCKVTMIERSPIMMALLKRGIEDLFKARSFDNLKLELIFADAKSYIASLPNNEGPDVIYLDPMYPLRTKSALCKKEMRILKDIVGDDGDAEELFLISLRHAKKRVVVKRPRLGKPILDRKPTIVFEGRSSRFDVYCCS